MTPILFPSWEQLPEIELYLDQVLSYVNKITNQAFETDDKPLTASMINNYVKHGHIQKPIKKKYNRHQLARLVIITILKNVFTIQDISTTMTQLLKEKNPQALYDCFVACMADYELDQTPPIIASACQTIKLYHHTRQLIPDSQGETYHESNL